MFLATFLLFTGVRQGPGFRQVLAWKIVFCPQAKKGFVLDQPRKCGSPRDCVDCVQAFVIPTGDLWGVGAHKAWAHQDSLFSLPLHLSGDSEATSCGSGSQLCRWLSAQQGRLSVFPSVLELFGGLEQSNLAPHRAGCRQLGGRERSQYPTTSLCFSYQRS